MQQNAKPTRLLAAFSKALCAASIGAVLTGCAALAPENPASLSVPSGADQASDVVIACSDVLQPEHQVELDAIDGLMEDKRHYAALARLESLSFATQAHWLRWAQLLAQVDQLAYSEEIFRSIARECESYRAYHGLGVVYVKQQKLDLAVEVLSVAKDFAPADAGVRNDYGYALMQIGRYDRAAFELRTAFELSDGNASSRQNMIAAYYLVGGDSSIADLRREVGITDEQIDRARTLARSIVQIVEGKP